MLCFGVGGNTTFYYAGHWNFYHFGVFMRPTILRILRRCDVKNGAVLFGQVTTSGITLHRKHVLQVNSPSKYR